METAFGEIITFYSYKGGVGRSMALANIACLLARKQKGDEKVLMIDWDLEAPGLHQFFHGRFDNARDEQKDLPVGQLGLIDLFYEIKNKLEKGEHQDAVPEDVFSQIDLQKYIVKVNRPSVLLMPAGRFDDGLYSTRVNEFDWLDFFNKFPSVIVQFAEFLRRKYKYVLIDSRTGYTDISGICTSIMPEKLVTVFTPNRQSLLGIVELIRRATNYRKQSDDLRPLMVFPLPSRIENAEEELQKEWRFGNPKHEGYQTQLASVLMDVYSLQECDLTKYFDEYQLQYKPKYSYGEEIAVLSERSEERLSLARSFENFTERIIGSENPWENTKDTEESNKKIVDVDENSTIRINPIGKLILRAFVVILVVAIVTLTYSAISNFIIPLLRQSQSISQFFYELLNSQFFGWLIIVWAVIDILWVKRWRMLIGRIGKIVSKPAIFKKDSEPHNLPLYPREFMESLAQHERIKDGEISSFIETQRDRIFDPKTPLKSLGHFIMFVGFIFFVLADSIIIANTLILLQIISPPLPDILQRLDYAVLGGSFLSSIVGVWMLIEMAGRGELLNTDTLSEAQKRIFKLIAGVVVLFSVLVMIALAYERLIIIGYLQTSPTTELLSSFILYSLLAINTSLAAALTLSSASSGFIVVLFLLFSVIFGLLPVLIFFLDILWRLLYIFVDIMDWILITPLMVIPYGIIRTIGLIDERQYWK